MRVLYISEVQWLSQVSRKHLIVRRLPRDWKVLFISPLNTARDENSFATRTDAVYRNVTYTSLPLPKPDSGFALVRALTGPLTAVGTRMLLRSAAAFEPDVVVCSYLWGAPAAARLHDRGIPLVYDQNDLHTSFYPARPLEAEEMFRKLLEEADEVVSSSSHLREIAGRGVVIGNGVDLNTFTGRRDVQKPPELAGSGLASCESLVCYVGSVDSRVDFGLLRSVGRRLVGLPKPTGLLVIGRVFDEATVDVTRLRDEMGDRVLFTGRVAYDRLPDFMSHADVGIAPFVLSPRTRAVNPNKLYMYAAMDMNVVSTPFSGDMEKQGGAIYVASGETDFADAVIEALGDDERRRATRETIALPNSWDEKASEFVDVLTRLTRRP